MWFVLGALVAAACIFLWRWAKSNNKILSWLDWLLALMVTGGVLMTFETVVGSIAEGEPRAAGLSFLLLGGVTIVLAILLWRRITGTGRKAQKAGLSQ